MIVKIEDDCLKFCRKKMCEIEEKYPHKGLNFVFYDLLDTLVRIEGEKTLDILKKAIASIEERLKKEDASE